MIKKENKRLRDLTNIQICKENKTKLILSNTVDECISKNKIRATLQIIAKSLSSTLGPDGSTTILQDREKQHLVTKDGLDVISSMTFRDEISRTVLDLVKTISTNQVLAVGDGSTSAIIVANALYQELTSPENRELFKNVSPKTVVDMISVVSKYLETEIKKYAIPVSEDLHEIANIASIAMNNDDEIGKIMQEAYQKVGKYGFISPDISEKYEKDVIDYKQGISWDYGYMDSVYAETFEDRKIIHNDPRIFIIDGTVTDKDIESIFNPLIQSVCGKAKESLVIVCNYVTDEAKNYLANIRQLYKIGKPELVFTVVGIDQVSDESRFKLKDMSLLCGCEIYNKALNNPVEVSMRADTAYQKEDKYKFIGKAIKATITKGSTEIICDDKLLSPVALEKKQSEVKVIRAELDKLNTKSALLMSNQEINTMYELKRRMSNLENLSAIYHVGGITFQEQKSRERLVEDAIFASKSAINYGYIPGGNITIPKIFETKSDEITKILKERYPFVSQSDEFFKAFIQILEDSFLQSYRAVLENSCLSDDDIYEILNNVIYNNKFYNLKTHTYEDIDKTTVINSTDTDIQIMKSCFSLISLLATSNQVITLNLNIEDQVEDQN